MGPRVRGSHRRGLQWASSVRPGPARGKRRIIRHRISRANGWLAAQCGARVPVPTRWRPSSMHLPPPGLGQDPALPGHCAELAQAIESGQLAPGEKLPPHRVLAKQLGSDDRHGQPRLRQPGAPGPGLRARGRRHLRAQSGHQCRRRRHAAAASTIDLAHNIAMPTDEPAHCSVPWQPGPGPGADGPHAEIPAGGWRHPAHRVGRRTLAARASAPRVCGAGDGHPWRPACAGGRAAHHRAAPATRC
jgi:hypothetical protein